MMRYLLVCATLCFSSTAWAQITVKIVDYPQRMVQHGPVIVTARVTNIGADPLLVPVAGGCMSSNGFFYATGPTGRDLETRCPPSPSRIGGAMWMEPGDQWLISGQVEEWLAEPGVYDIQVKLRGLGQCNMPSSSELPVNPIRSGVFNSIYPCWRGVVESSRVLITIVKPTERDRQALEYAKSLSLRVPESCLSCLFSRAHDALLARFPDSHYTYLSGYYGEGGDDLERVLELQPDHELAPYAQMKLALRSLYRSGPGASAVTDEYMQGLPDVLKNYVTQEQQRRGIPVSNEPLD